jgi:hypothetical protein
VLSYILVGCAGAAIGSALTVVVLGFGEMGLLPWRPWRRRKSGDQP